MSEEVKEAVKESVSSMDDRETKELLRELLEFEKREAKYQKVTSILIFCLVLIMGIVSFMIVPVAVQTLTVANATIVQAQAALTQICEEVDKVGVMVDSITATSNNMNSMVETNSQDLTNAVQNLTTIDFQGLNKAISDLQDAVGPLAKFGRALGG